MSQPSQTPFVFQVSSALREFILAHAGERAVDFSIGTPPTSAAIQAKQMELIFGTNENPFSEGSFLYMFFEKLRTMIANMGRYEITGGKNILKQRFEKEYEVLFGHNSAVTIVSGGAKKAVNLWEKVEKKFEGIEVTVIHNEHEARLAQQKNNAAGHGGTLFIVSTPLMERCSLAAVIGPSLAVEALESLHTCILGTPSTPQEDLFLLLEEIEMKNFLENLGDEEEEHGLSEIIECISMLYREPLSLLGQEKVRLKKNFETQFLNCFFKEKNENEPVQIVCGNGGGRQALHVIENILADRGLKNMILFKPHWTYSNVYRQAQLISLNSAENGEPNFDILEKTLQKIAYEYGCAEGPNKGEEGILTAITINSPNNPCGVIYSVKTLERLLTLCQKYNVAMIDDGCYIEIVRSDETAMTLLEVAIKMTKNGQLKSSFLKNIFVAMTASKGLGMAGGRLGAVIFFDESLRQEFEKLYSDELPNMTALFLASKLMEDSSSFAELLKTINEEIDERVKLVTKILGNHKLIYRRPQGAFYLELKVPFLKKMVNDMKIFALTMAREKGVAFMPMEVFGGEKYAIRLSLGGEKSAVQLREEMEVLVSQLQEFELL